MLIGISGKKQSGKDTIGKIIQYLIWENSNHTELHNLLKKEGFGVTFNDFIEQRGESFSSWKIRKFAEPLKQICAILLGVLVEKFEDEEFKNSELGEEWNYVSNKCNCSKYYGSTDTVFNNICCNCGNIEENSKMTPRLLLQKVGTDALRDNVHPNTWVNALFADYEDPKQWIITDVRFPNEFNAVKDRGGINIRVNREFHSFYSEHISETALDNNVFDYYIDNNGTIEELIEKVREFLTINGLLK